ncbi:glycosyltransferase family 4 protein [soil metagenome]
MHVALFTHRYPPARGGAEYYAAKLATHLQQHGNDVTVWTTSAIKLEEFWHGCLQPSSVQDSIRRYRPIAFPLRRYVLKTLSLLTPPRLRSWVLPCNPVCPGMLRDVLHSSGPLDCVHATAFPYAWPILCGLRLARRHGVPFHLTPFLHLGDERTRKQYTQPALRWLLNEADRVFVQTKLEYDALLELGVKRDRVTLQGLGVDVAECTGGDRERFRSSHAPVIGHLANLSCEKGTVDLLRACEQLWQRGRMFRVVLAGADMANFRDYWNGFAFKDRVTLMGPLSDDTKRDFYACIDIFALPSRTDSFGLVLLEAWANGKPNVAYACGGPSEIIRHNIDGLLAETGNIVDLANQFERLIADDSLRVQLGEAGSDRIADEFDWESKLEVVTNHMMIDASQFRSDHPRNAWESLTPRLS